MSRTICFFVGNAAAPNVKRLVSNVGVMLSSEFSLHLVTTAASEFSSSALDHYSVFGRSESAGIVSESAALWNYLREHRPAAVVQLTRPPVHGTISGLLSRRFRVPFVYRYAGDRFVSYKVTNGNESLAHFGLNNVVGRVPFHVADKRIVMGPSGRDRLVEYGADPESVRILPPSIDPARFELADDSPGEIAVPDGRKIAMFVGRLSRLKGIETIEATLPTILDRRPDLQFVFVGDDRQTPTVPDRFTDRITTVGTVPPEAIPYYLDRASVLVHPTLIEGLPRVVLEALAMDTRVIARDVGDVSYATQNTFRTDQEFVELVTAFEGLPVDEVEPFEVATLRDEYVSFFEEQFQTRTDTHSTEAQ